MGGELIFDCGSRNILSCQEMNIMDMVLLLLAIFLKPHHSHGLCLNTLPPWLMSSTVYTNGICLASHHAYGLYLASYTSMAYA